MAHWSIESSEANPPSASLSSNSASSPGGWLCSWSTCIEVAQLMEEKLTEPPFVSKARRGQIRRNKTSGKTLRKEANIVTADLPRHAALNAPAQAGTESIKADVV
ncbi:hypothetical protein KP509_12G007100 [Ceratopteris richardii]|uniref:Uncharacterized protein n=1 Tax=Ceratopteris richardii TaxID=49495 RepID=A0A8T2TGB5_CERRI|nr:hypothetical protein KP509_12G007100 [Ceratopteris richardii]